MVTTPSFLFDTYKRHKDQTQTFITWLGETARQCGQSIQPEGMAKGKSKKKAQAPLVTKLALSDIVTLAKAISQSGSAVEIPSNILQSLKFVIAQRKKCAAWFSQQHGDETLHKANEGHSFVIGIFEKAFGILSPSTNQTQPPANKRATVEGNEDDEDSEIEFINSFAGLEVEDFSDTEVNSWAQSVTVPKKKKASSKNIYEMENSEEDLLFNLFCFFSDLNEIRTYLKGLWSAYHQGKLDLITVSIATDTAFDIIDRAEEEFVHCIPPDSQNRGSYVNSAGRLWNCMGGHSAKEDAEYTEEFYPLTDWLCLHTYRTLYQYLALLVTKDLFVPAMEVGTVDHSTPRAKLSPRQKADQDSTIISEFMFFIELVSAALATTKSPFHDKLCKGLAEAMLNFRRGDRTPRIWLTFALQIYLDIHYILKSEVKRGLDDLRRISMRFVDIMAEYSRFVQNIRPSEKWDADNDMVFNDITYFIQYWVYDDFVGAHRARIIKNHGTNRQKVEEAKKKPPPFQYLSNHPLMCGLMAASITLNLQKHSIACCEAWGTLMSVAHLYNDSIQLGYNKTSWPDVEALVQIHGEGNMFIGGLPKTAPECYRRFGLVNGVSPRNHAPDKRRQPGKKSGEAIFSNKTRGIINNSTVSAIFLHRYAPAKGEDPHLELTLPEVERILNQSAARQDSSPAISNTITKSTSSLLLDQNSPRESAIETRLAKRFEKSHKLTPIELLTPLVSTLQSEHAAMHFPYLAMHIRCMRLLRAVLTSLGNEPKEMYPQYIRFWDARDQDLRHVTGWIFMTSSAMDHLTTEQRNDKEKFEKYMGWVIKASKLVEKFAKEKGGKEMEKVRKWKEEDLGSFSRRIVTLKDIGLALWGEAGPYGTGKWEEEVKEEEVVKVKKRKPRKKKKKKNASGHEAPNDEDGGECEDGFEELPELVG